MVRGAVSQREWCEDRGPDDVRWFKEENKLNGQFKEQKVGK